MEPLGQLCRVSYVTQSCFRAGNPARKPHFRREASNACEHHSTSAIRILHGLQNAVWSAVFRSSVACIVAVKNDVPHRAEYSVGCGMHLYSIWRSGSGPTRAQDRGRKWGPAQTATQRLTCYKLVDVCVKFTFERIHCRGFGGKTCARRAGKEGGKCNRNNSTHAGIWSLNPCFGWAMAATL